MTAVVVLSAAIPAVLAAPAGVRAALLDDDAAAELDAVAEQTVDKDAAEALPEGRFVADSEALHDLWDELDLPGEELPEVDFEDNLLLIEHRDAADPNHVRYSAMLNEDGELEVGAMTTLMGFPPSDRVKLVFLAYPREGVTAVARYVQYLDDNGDVAVKRVVYPIDD